MLEPGLTGTHQAAFALNHVKELLRTGPGPERKMHKKGSDRSSRALNWWNRRHFSMRVFFVFKKIKKRQKILKKHEKIFKIHQNIFK